MKRLMTMILSLFLFAGLSTTFAKQVSVQVCNIMGARPYSIIKPSYLTAPGSKRKFPIPEGMHPGDCISKNFQLQINKKYQYSFKANRIDKKGKTSPWYHCDYSDKITKKSYFLKIMVRNYSSDGTANCKITVFNNP